VAVQKFEGEDALEEHKKIRLEEKKKTRRDNPLRRKAAEKLKAGTPFFPFGSEKTREKDMALMNRRNRCSCGQETAIANARRVPAAEQRVGRAEFAGGNDVGRTARGVRNVRVGFFLAPLWFSTSES